MSIIKSQSEQHSAKSRVEPATSVELRVLLACLRAKLDNSQLAELLEDDISWSKLIELAGWHGVIPLLARRLVGNPATPPEVVESLRGFALTNAARNLSLSVELTKLCAALAAQKIPSIPYKGTVLSQQLYGSTALRCAYDIDLIVRSEDALGAIACLEELGFEDESGLTHCGRVNALRYGFEHGFVRGETNVDLHWRVVPHYAWPSLDFERLWSNLVAFSFCGSELQTISGEWLLVVLCVHAAQHDWMHLKMLSDIAELLSQNSSLDWQSIEVLTADSHSRRSLLVGLSLAHSHLGAELPKLAETAIDSDGRVAQIASCVSSMWMHPRDPTPEHIDLHWLLFRTKGERWIDRWRYIFSVALMPTMADFWSVELPWSLGWLYFVVRPARIILARLRRSGLRQ